MHGIYLCSTVFFLFLSTISLRKPSPHPSPVTFIYHSHASSIFIKFSKAYRETPFFPPLLPVIFIFYSLIAAHT